ncbi:ATP-binding protein [Acidisphaera sp. S103]|uniref:ATP-binding protein n=1 Tax=Acidisphaera sp. S103 TaxID=1747223 RepID=UPI0020B11AF4|nr:ATP-binding protein [Acidisphaera sp. S103]
MTSDGSGSIREAEQAAEIARLRQALDEMQQCLDESTSREVATEIAHRQDKAIEAAKLFSSEAANVALEEAIAQRVAAMEEMQATLIQSQKMEAIGQLTGGLAHDFNNLLTSITGSLELLQTRMSQGRINDLDRYITMAQGAAKRATILTHRLLAFSRRQTLDPKPSDLNRLVAGMEDMVRRTVGINIQIEVAAAGGLWPVFIDPPQLENALLNLCINARDAMPDGGKLSIETANRWLDIRGAQERDVPPGQYVSLCVSDNGSGMPPDVVTRAFDPFYTTKPTGEGTGLGLSMVYGFVRQSGGQIRIYSEVDKGTMVCLYLPRHHEAADAVEELNISVVDMPHGEAGQTVLIVDDESSVRIIIVEVLTELGYSVVEAADATSALKILNSNVPVDLLITDVGLPHGLNGRQLADAARLKRPALRVLFITGYAENAVVSHGHLAHDMHVVMKPFTLDALSNRVKEIISKPDGCG